MGITVKNPNDPAAIGQISYIAGLLKEREVPEAQAKLIQDALDGKLATFNKGIASQMIDWLCGLPKTATPAPVPGHHDTSQGPQVGVHALPEGFYAAGGYFYQVVKSRTSGKLYAKRWNTTGVRWEYSMQRWDYRVLTNAPDRRLMTQAEAVEIGTSTGVCVICGRKLTDKDSIYNKIGPVCAKRMSWTWVKAPGLPV